MVKDRTYIKSENFINYLAGDNDKNNGKNNDKKKKEDLIEIEYKGGENEIYAVKKDGEIYDFSLKYFRNFLQNLRPYADYLISSLSSERVSELSDIISARKILKGTKGYQLLLDEISKIFSDLEVVNPNTIGSYFRGCFINDNFPGNKVCNPRCSPGFLPEGEDEDCDSLVIIYQKGKFIVSNEIAETNGGAYIYVDGKDFIGFKESDIKALEELGVKNVIMVYGSIDGTNNYKEITGNLTLDQLPINNKDKNITPEKNQVSGWVIFIIIVVILVLIGVLIFRNK